MSKEIRTKFGVNEEKPNQWFETLYAETNVKGEGVPWANMASHPMFKSWLLNNSFSGKGKTALVVGCGLGDDAIELESLGFKVTAFDVSDSAIELCKKRFPTSTVNFVQADLIKGIPEWKHQFDVVLEIFTIQALPPKYENVLIEHIADFVKENGQLILITEIKEEKRNFENGPPWLLNSTYINAFESLGLQKSSQLINTTTEMGDEIHLTIFQK